MTNVIRRVRRRPPLEQDPIRRGRFRGFLSDGQIDDIRYRKSLGETLQELANVYHVEPSAISAIVNYRTYKEPESKYPFSFNNRLVKS